MVDALSDLTQLFLDEHGISSRRLELPLESLSDSTPGTRSKESIVPPATWTAVGTFRRAANDSPSIPPVLGQGPTRFVHPGSGFAQDRSPHRFQLTDVTHYLNSTTSPLIDRAKSRRSNLLPGLLHGHQWALAQSLCGTSLDCVPRETCSLAQPLPKKRHIEDRHDPLLCDCAWTFVAQGVEGFTDRLWHALEDHPHHVGFLANRDSRVHQPLARHY